MVDAFKSEQLVTCPVAFAARRDGTAIAVVHRSGSVSFEELDQLVSGVCTRLRDERVDTGGRVALAANNSLELICVMLALNRMGAVAVMLPMRYPAEALSRIAERTRSEVVVVDRRDPPQVHSGFRVLSLLDLHGVTTGKHFSETPELHPELPAIIVCTSGSTGEPRPVVLSRRSLFYSAVGANRHVALVPGDRWLLSLPLYHVAGLGIVFRCLLAGAAFVIPKDPRNIAGEAAAHEVSHLSLVPTQLRRLMSAQRSLGAVREILVGGGPTPASLLNEARRLRATVRTTYGLTEMGSQVTTTSDNNDEDFTSGTVLPYRSVRIGMDNQIFVRGETLFSGYVVDGDIVPALDAEGWYPTGDRGSLDARGRLTVLGRGDNMFVSGGENIFPEEIERVLDNTRGIVRSVVVDVPDEEYGARPVAFVEYEHEPVHEEDVYAALGQVLPRFKWPMALFTLPRAPEAGLSKIDRRHLRRIAYIRLRDKGLSRSDSLR